ncbi:MULTISPECIES: GGDEF domain-containing protein [unclassified Arsukibacterium]|uniref:GGDEF domain-containing protein n=1 Tax=unclassified Arsukibacterium TaxID=2635278 RepID=UPI000C5C958A|nr:MULTISPECIES: GGDEF domain-containing protein [unclassified Arsukibacterium]MAA96235.1 diguanylate cyclase [Rheinheimera sp.]MBM34877.1 diguanylate cyclase [Rheinheimera sp.]
MGLSDYHRDELRHILANKRLTPLFQPIVRLSDGKNLGFEALIRGPSNSALHSPGNLFKTAISYNLLEPLELLCRELSINAFAKAGAEGLLFLNVNPLLLLTSDHPSGLTKKMIEAAGLAPEQIVIELSEQFQVEDTELFINAVKHYREFGFKIAIDDLGSGFSGLRLWSELQPDIVKIDRYFIDQLHQDPIKKAFVKNIIEIAKDTGSSIIAEGIETSEELQMCRELGAEYGQGYLLGRPHSEFQDSPMALAPLLQSNPLKLNQALDPVITLTPAVAMSTLAVDVAELFANDRNLNCIAVVDNQQFPVGVVSRSVLNEKFSHTFGRALYQRKAISYCMEKVPLLVEKTMSIDDVSSLISEDADDAGLHFLVTDNERYYGFGSVRKVLKQISENKVFFARYTNPLTLLPGNVPLNLHIDTLLQQNKMFSVAYIDIDFFKPYNDIYGYSKGDLVIELLAKIIQAEVPPGEAFIYHIGGDDFIVVFSAASKLEVLARIQASFNERIQYYYSSEHLTAGGCSAVDRLGQPLFYPLISLSIGLVEPDPQLCSSQHDVSELASSAKREAKKISGSSIFHSRRRGPVQLCQHQSGT